MSDNNSNKPVNEHLNTDKPISSAKEKREQKKQLRLQEKADKKQKKEAKKEEKRKKRTRWFYFFILLLLVILLLAVFDSFRNNKIYKEIKTSSDSLRQSEVFYKTKYHEKDSSLNMLLASYNSLLQENIDNSEILNSKKSELLKMQKVIYIQDSILRGIQNSINRAFSGYNADEISVELVDGKLYVTMRNKLLFPSGSSNVKTKGVSALKSLAKILKDDPKIDIIVEGHTDNVPISPKDKNYKDNWDLSTDRAITITRLLTDTYKIRPERITAAGRSMYFPIAPNTTDQGRAKNRRIEIILSPNLSELYKLLEQKPVS